MPIVPCTIAARESLSAPADLGEFQLTAIITPAAWTPASITFQVSVDGGATFYDYYGVGKFTETVMPVQPSRMYKIALLTLPGGVQIRIRSGIAALPVAQAAGRTFSLITV